MTISKDLFLAILSMDSYNRGYGTGIELSDAVDTKIGAAKIGKRIQDVSDTFGSEAQAAGFYAIAYDVDGSGPSGLAGKTVISYRGTDAAL
ncbi:hypothetical protein [Profundibacter sp.]|uniref:hypothetical protein n=1 Tax=Profundibacter sp. TaxID=3101071 RepID=UPI003D0BFE9E